MIRTPQTLSTQPIQAFPYQVESGARQDFKTLVRDLGKNVGDSLSPPSVGDLQLGTRYTCQGQELTLASRRQVIAQEHLDLGLHPGLWYSPALQP